MRENLRWFLAADLAYIIMVLWIARAVYLISYGGDIKQLIIAVIMWVLDWSAANRAFKYGFGCRQLCRHHRGR